MVSRSLKPCYKWKISCFVNQKPDKQSLLSSNSRSNIALREKCPNTELILVGIVPHSDWIRRDTPCLFVFSPNAGKYGPELIPYFGTFHAALHISTMENCCGDYLLHVTKWKISLFTQHVLIKMVSLVKKQYQFFFTY